MNWISKDEQEIIKEWAAFQTTQQLSDCYLSYPDKEQSSYWEVHDEDKEICIYAFETAEELQQILEGVFSDTIMKDLILPLMVAGLKSRKRIDEAVKQMLSQQENTEYQKDAFLAIPEFRYVF